ncbi:hypothetical protein J6590_029879 [Homalodisca vitripennis]|nr:hypothetical protein J6590_029879 [Homalodisca vitripennis]
MELSCNGRESCLCGGAGVLPAFVLLLTRAFITCRQRTSGNVFPLEDRGPPAVSFHWRIENNL